MDPLQLVAERQGIWSATATLLKAHYDRARSLVFTLSLGGAVLATIASQLRQEDPARQPIALTAALCFAIVTFITARALGAQSSTLWLRARAASEALKKEAFTYAARAEPYDDPATRKTKLNRAREDIEQGVDEIIGHAVSAGKSSAPRGDIAPEEYISTRVEKQITGYFEPRANAAQRTASRLRWIEAVLALTAACLTTAAGIVSKIPVGTALFDIAALTGIITTIASATVAHIAAGRYDFTVANYRATARRLRNALADAPESFTAPSPQWSAFVRECEGILWDANNTWLSKWGKAAESPGATARAATAPPTRPIAADAPERAPAAASDRVVNLNPPGG